MKLMLCASAFTPSESLENITLVIEGNKIVELNQTGSMNLPEEAQIIDARGLIAAPGYIDWQINGGFGHDFTADPESLWEVACRLPEHGVTAFLPTIVSAPLEVYTKALQVLRAGPPANFKGAQPLGFHFEGPFLNPDKKGAHNKNLLRQPLLADLPDWSRENGLWLVTLAPELDGAFELIRGLRERGVVVSAGHSQADIEAAKRAIQAGLRGGTHLFNAMPPLEQRSPGLAAALLKSSEVIVGFIPDGLHLHPDLIDLVWRLKGAERVAIVTDAMSALGMPSGDYPLAGYNVRVDETSARLADGTLAGSILRMDEAVRNLSAFTGCSLREAVYSATAAPANLIGAVNKGWLRPGADADIVLLTPQGEVMGTIIKGNLVYQSLAENCE